MKTEFSRLMTSDGLEFAGLFFTPDSGPADITVVHVHGLAGNFYENRFVDIVAEAVCDQGINFMAFNNRGHDYISDSIHVAHDGGELDYLLIGGAYENFEDSVLDIDAYIQFARSNGSTKFVLQGHSHGALKVAYYLTRRENPDIVGCSLLSPSDDFEVQRERVGDKFDEALSAAKSKIDNGKGIEWVPEDHFPYPISADSYYDTFRPDSPLKIFNLAGTEESGPEVLSKITAHCLGIVGTVEEYFRCTPDEFIAKMKDKLENAASFEGAVIDGAPHNYILHDNELASVIADWLETKIQGTN